MAAVTTGHLKPVDDSYPVAVAERVNAGTRTSRREGGPRADRRGTIPERLNYLFETVLTPGGKQYSADKVADWINRNGGQITSVYINKLLKGERSNPSLQYLSGIAKFFGISVNFFDADDPPEINGPLHSAMIVLREVATASVLDRYLQLSPASQRALSDILDSLLRVEGKAPDPDEDTQ